jgi:hypothetical protein
MAAQNLKARPHPHGPVLMVRRFFLIDEGECLAFEVIPSFSTSVDPTLRHGWLCFDYGDQRRRFAPIPKNWDKLSETALWQICARGKPVVRIGP